MCSLENGKKVPSTLIGFGTSGDHNTLIPLEREMIDSSMVEKFPNFHLRWVMYYYVRLNRKEQLGLAVLWLNYMKVEKKIRYIM